MISKAVIKEVCREILNKKSPSPEVEVGEFRVDERGTTFAQEFLVNLTVKNDENNKCSFVFKTPLEDRQDEFRKEALIYGNLPSEQKIAPLCFYINEHVLVLENLKFFGYKNCDEMFLDEVHVKLVLKSIATFHSLRYVDGIEGSKTIVDLLFCCHQELVKKTKSVEPKKLGWNGFEEKLSQLYQEMIANLEPSKEFLNVVNHGNLRRENLLFLYENGVPVDCKLVNLHFAHYSPAANDVLFLLLNVTAEEDRRRRFQDYLEYYYRCVCENNESTLQWNDFHLYCKNLLPSSKLKSFYFTLEESNMVVSKLEIVLTNNYLSEEDCFAILNKKLGTTNYILQSFSIHGFSERSGYLGDHFNLKTDVLVQNRKKQLSFFVKTIPSTPSQKEFSITSGAFFKEHQMFTKLVPLLEKYGVGILGDVIPRTYLCRLNDVIVQEDLIEQGLVKLSSQKCLDFGEAETILKYLAKFHAAFVILEERVGQETGRTYRLSEDFGREFEETFFSEKQQHNGDIMHASKTGARASVDAFYKVGKFSKETLLGLLEDAIDKQSENVKSSKYFRNTVGHGDLWVTNMLFKYEGDCTKECRIVDFQSYRYLPPAHDVLCTVYMTTDRAFRKKHLTQLLNLYFDELSETFAKYGFHNAITKEEFEESCRFYRESALTQTMTHFQAILMPPEVSKYLFENPEELRKVFFEEKYEFLTENFTKYPYFRRRSEESLLDLIEHFESVYSD